MNTENKNLFEASVQMELARKSVKKHIDENCNGEDHKNILLKIAGVVSIIEDMGRTYEQPQNQASLFEWEVDLYLNPLKKEPITSVEEYKCEMCKKEMTEKDHDFCDICGDCREGEDEKDEEKETTEESTELSEDEVEAEMKRLEEELNQDVESGLLENKEQSNLFDYYLIEDDSKLVIRNHVDAILLNLPSLAKKHLDDEWAQNCNADKIMVDVVKKDETTIIHSVRYTNEFGVKIRVLMPNIVKILDKIDFSS